MSLTTDQIKKAYLDPNYGFSGLYTFIRKVTEKHPKTDIATIKRVVESLPAYALHKTIRKKRFITRKYVASTINHLWFADLMFLTEFRKQNRNYHVVLVVYDIFSKMIYTSNLKNKTGASVAKGFADIIEKCEGNAAIQISTDAGGEFLAAPFQKILKEYGIAHHVARGSQKASPAERVIRLLKEYLHRYFESTNSRYWLTVIPKIVDNLNNTKRKQLGMAPVQVTHSNAPSVFERMYGDYIKKMKEYRNSIQEKQALALTVGTPVRLYLIHNPFEKRYRKVLTDEVFRISKVIRTYPVTYEIADANGERI